MNARVKAAQLLIEYTAGKPATTPPKPAAPLERPLSEWTDEELEALAASEPVEAAAEQVASLGGRSGRS